MKFFILLISFLICNFNTFGHSGRTDSRGGHFNRSTGIYHYHNSAALPSPPKVPGSSKEKIVQGKYWINSSSGTRHKKGCRWFGSTKEGFYTNRAVGKACGNCGD
jgi:hypothetical protein